MAEKHYIEDKEVPEWMADAYARVSNCAYEANNGPREAPPWMWIGADGALETIKAAAEAWGEIDEEARSGSKLEYCLRALVDIKAVGYCDYVAQVEARRDTPESEVRKEINDFLDRHPEWEKLSGQSIADKLANRKVYASRNMVNRVKTDRKKARPGA